MKSLVCLLFLQGFLCNPNPLEINPDSLVTWKGSCVVIPCQINRYNGALLTNISLLWKFYPFNNRNYSAHSGVLLYFSSPESSFYGNQTGFADRLRFVGGVQNNLETKSCRLKISDVRTEDSGIYKARLSASYQPPAQKDEWILNATINVAESPLAPKMDTNPKDIQEGWTRVTCSVPYHCPETLLRLTISGLQVTRLSSQSTTLNDEVIQTIVDLQITWKDHGKPLICSLKRLSGLEISRSTMKLDVIYAPKDVRLIASPGTSIREGETLSLECTLKGSNPEILEYLWYKDGQVVDEWNLKKIEFKTKRDQHSGTYRCEAKNSAGTQTSEDLVVDIQPPLHSTSTPAASGPEPITESEGPQSSPTPPSPSSSPSPSASCPTSGPSQTPWDDRTLWEEFSFLSESENRAVNPRFQLIHNCQELKSAVIHLTEKFRKALLQIKQRTCVVPSTRKKK